MYLEKRLELLQWLRQNRDRWNQHHWTSILVDFWDSLVDRKVSMKLKKEEGHTINCGTTACVAGHAAFMFAPVGTKFFREDLLLPDKKRRTYPDYAEEVLGLERRDALWLFDSERSWEEITHFLEFGEKIDGEA